MVDSLKNKPSVESPQPKPKKIKGGPRPGSGRPKGKQDARTLDRIRVLQAYKQRILNNADKLLNAQLALAVGVSHLFRVDETVVDGKTKREHVLVTDPDEIKKVLDENDGGDGKVDESYYYISTKDPDNRAIDSMLDRTFGKAVQAIAGIDDDGNMVPLKGDQIDKMTPEEVDDELKKRVTSFRKPTKK